MNSQLKLYHYTSREGLEGIWKTQILRATHYQDLNDTSECRLIVDPLKAEVADEVKKFVADNKSKYPDLRKLSLDPRRLRKLIQEESSKLVDIPLSLMFDRENVSGKVSFFHPYILSFCSHANKPGYVKKNGLLSQWRGYGASGGYALVIDGTELSKLLELEKSQFLYAHADIDQVRYNTDGRSFLKGFGSEVNQIRHSSRAMIERVTGQLEKSVTVAEIESSYAAFARMASLFKHQGFYEEEETRIVAAPWREGVLDEQLREDPSHLDSHVDKKIKQEQTDKGKRSISLFADSPNLPIDRIIVGPSQDQEENFQFAKDITRNRVRISRSKTPYVG